MSCLRECTSTAVVTISRNICWARVLILILKSDARAEEKPKDKKQNKIKFVVKKLEEMKRLGRGMKFMLLYITMV